MKTTPKKQTTRSTGTDLVKEAIADAKLIREIAERNARTAIEEAFAPRIQSMISRKIAEDAEMEDPEIDDEFAEDTADFEEQFMFEDEEGEFDDVDADADTTEMDEPYGGEYEDEFADEETFEITDDEPAGADSIEQSYVNPEEETEEDNELEEALAYLNEEEDEEAEIELNLESDEYDDEEEVMESLRLENRKLKKSLAEHIKVIKFMKTQMNESNLLSTKLHYCNQVFKKHSLSESQKAKVLNVFDKAKNIQEVKLAYTAINESISKPVLTKKAPVKKDFKQYMKESFSSKPVKSTKPAKQPILESDDFVSKMQRLAGLRG